MNENKDATPHKPEESIISGLKSGVLFAAIFAACSPVLHKFFKDKAPLKERMVDSAIVGGLTGLVVGYAKGERKQAEYPLKQENVKLQKEIKELKTDKSFAQTVAAQNSQKELESNTPSR